MLRPQKGNTEVSFTDTLLNFGLRAYSVPEFLEYKSVQNAKVYQSTGMNKVCMEWTEYQSETSEELNTELYIDYITATAGGNPQPTELEIIMQKMVQL